MILLHLFYSIIPRGLDTPRMRVIARAGCVIVLAMVVAGAVSRGEETPPQAEPPAASTGRGNVSIIHVGAAAEHEQAPAAAEANAGAEHGSEKVAAEPAPQEDRASAESTPGVPSDHESAEPAAQPPTEHAVAESASAHGEAPAVAEQVDSEHTATAAAEHAEAPAPEIHHSAEHPEAHASPALHDEKPGHAQAPVAHDGGAADDGINDMAESGRRFWQAGEYEAAEKAFTRALTANVPVERKRDLVLEMAGLYRGANQLPKAAAILEKFIKTYPNDRDVPRVLLQLGTVYRDLGVYTMATARFFQVLNSTLRVSDQDIPEYRQLAMKARLEIAETYAMQGNLTEAEKYFSRLQLLDLEPADRERVLLRGAQMQFTLKQWLTAEKALATFMASNPESAHLSEARYMRAKALDELGRKQEAIDEVVTLLQTPSPGEPEAARSAAYWKRRCANELANRFYEQGDFLGALAVYQALARASMDPTWRWPAIYQIGLCFERMDMPQRAAEAYDVILAPETAPAAGTKLPESLASLQDMARWRRSHLVWIEDKDRQLESLVGTTGKPAS